MTTIGSYAGEHWGDFVTVVGFALTLYFVIKAKTTATAVKTAMDKLRKRVTHLDGIYVLAEAKAATDRLMLLQDSGKWEEALPGYALLRHDLISVAENKSGFDEEEQTLLEAAVGTLSDVEKSVRDAIYVDQSPTSPSDLTAQLSLAEDQIVKLIARLRAKSMDTE